MASIFTEAIVESARELTEREFVARAPGLFFITVENLDDLPTGFRTAVVEFTSSVNSRRLDRGFEIVPLEKNGANPFSDRISIGRARNCDLVLRHDSVSKLHAHVRSTEGGFELIDLKSKNGTRVDGELLSPNLPRRLALGAAVHFGSLQARFVDAKGLYELLRAPAT